MGTIICTPSVFADTITPTISRAAVTRGAVTAPTIDTVESDGVTSRPPNVVGRGLGTGNTSTGAAPSASRVATTGDTTSRAAITSNPDSSATPTIGRAAASSTSAARAAAPNSVASRARAGENARELSSTDAGTRTTDASDKGIANQSSAVRRAGVSLRPSTAEVGGRATVNGTNVMTGSNVNDARTAVPRTARAATSTAIVGATAVNADSLAAWEATNSVNETCRQQYSECMDQFCNVIDSNQGRCSCSAGLANYNKIEKTVKSANEQLNEVAQRIRYVGLSADEIRAIMSATEAELELAGAKDKTESRKMLEQIEKLISDPNAFAQENSTNGILDLDLDFTEDLDFSDWFDINFGSGSSFSNKRGTQLLSAAKNKCAPVLNACKANGADIAQVQSNYELQVEKDCLKYEQGLDKMNSTLKTNVRAATTMLQKARLAVLQDQNTYDTRGCLNQLEQCMTDDMVCGSNYYKCIDPSKQFIDENGEVVLGRDVTGIEAFMAKFSNMDPDLKKAMSISGYSNCAVEPNNDGSCIVKYLLDKIGTGGTTTGLCRPVLDKCRRVTYDSKDKYDPTNEVIKNYIQRTMTNISSAQKRIITDYAASCMSDISSCYSQQVAQVSAWSSNANLELVYKVMKGACRNIALTCSYAVFSGESDKGATGSCPRQLGVQQTAAESDKCIESISEVFYQSLLCPVNSVYASEGTVPPPTSLGSYTKIGSTRCFCEPGYSPSSGLCVKNN